MPTILDYCGVEPPEELHGVSIASLIEGKTEPVREGVAGEFHSCNWTEDPVTPLRMWRTKNYKYVESQIGDNEFYNLTEDPNERNNLIDDPQCREQIEAMRSALSDWQKDTGDSWPQVAEPPTGFLRKRG